MNASDLLWGFSKPLCDQWPSRDFGNFWRLWHVTCRIEGITTVLKFTCSTYMTYFRIHRFKMTFHIHNVGINSVEVKTRMNIAAAQLHSQANSRLTPSVFTYIRSLSFYPLSSGSAVMPSFNYGCRSAFDWVHWWHHSSPTSVFQ